MRRAAVLVLVVQQRRACDTYLGSRDLGTMPRFIKVRAGPIGEAGHRVVVCSYRAAVALE